MWWSLHTFILKMKKPRLDLSDDFPSKSRALTRTEFRSHKYQSHELVIQTSFPKPGWCVQHLSIQMCLGRMPGAKFPWESVYVSFESLHELCLHVRVWFISSGCSCQGFPPFLFPSLSTDPPAPFPSQTQDCSPSHGLSSCSGFSRARPAVLGAGCIFFPSLSLL